MPTRTVGARAPPAAKPTLLLTYNHPSFSIILSPGEGLSVWQRLVFRLRKNSRDEKTPVTGFFFF
jgi:hypothetical protein